jgi:hypothetical protein
MELEDAAFYFFGFSAAFGAAVFAAAFTGFIGS